MQDDRQNLTNGIGKVKNRPARWVRSKLSRWLGSVGAWALLVARLAAACFALSVICLAPVRAQPAAVSGGALQACVRAALTRTRAAGVAPGPLRTTFLLSGDSQVFSQRFTKSDCVGFVAAGARHTQAIEVVVQSAEGRPLARSATPATLAYAVHCGHAGEQVFATVRVLDGQGEVVYVPLEHADGRPAALASLEECPALGTPRPAPVAVGPEPVGKSIEEQFAVARAELTELGYGTDQVIGFGTLPADQHDARGVVLDPERCYALVAVGSRDILDLDLRVFGPRLPLSPAGIDVSRKRGARVKLCAEAPARYVLDVSAFQGEGAYAVQAFELNEPAAAPGIVGPMRIPYAEALARMRRRGMLGQVLTSGIVNADDAIGIPLSLRAGACYAVAALAAADPDNAGLQLGLRDEHGELLALDTRPNAGALVFHCAQHDELLQAVVRSSQSRAASRFVLVLGRPRTREEAASE